MADIDNMVEVFATFSKGCKEKQDEERDVAEDEIL
jgi:hypothetical protein